MRYQTALMPDNRRADYRECPAPGATRLLRGRGFAATPADGTGDASCAIVAPMALRPVTKFLAVAAAAAAPVVWEVAASVALVTAGISTELTLLLVIKGGFAATLLLVLVATGGWRACGFGGGPQFGHWKLLWPLWLAALAAGAQFVAGGAWTGLGGWLVIAFAVAVGEEGIFRGAVMALLGTDRPRRNVLVSAALFGAVHLVGLAAPVDWRMIVAQALAAFGLGVPLGVVRLRSGSIWPGIAAHGTMDFLGLAVAGGIGQALAFSAGDLAFMLAGGAISLAWGLHLCGAFEQSPVRQHPLGSGEVFGRVDVE